MTPNHPDGRHTPAALRTERVRVAHWRRLVRARMDLAAAAVAVPEALGEHVRDLLPAGVDDDLPTHVGLVDAVSAGGPAGEIDRLEALRELDRRLARYEVVVVHRLRLADAGRLAPHPRPAPRAGAGAVPGGAPTRAPDARRPGPGPMGQTVPRT